MEHTTKDAQYRRKLIHRFPGWLPRTTLKEMIEQGIAFDGSPSYVTPESAAKFKKSESRYWNKKIRREQTQAIQEQELEQQQTTKEEVTQ